MADGDHGGGTGRGAEEGWGGRPRFLDCKRIYEGKLLKIDLERVALPNGATATLEIIRHPGASAVAPLRPDGSVVMIRQYRRAAGGVIFEVPAGKLDPGDTPESCAHREVREEAGLAMEALFPLGFIHTTPGFTDEVIHLFAGTGLSSVPVAREEDELIEVVEMPLEAAVDLVREGAITDAKTVCTLLRAHQEVSAGRLGS